MAAAGAVHGMAGGWGGLGEGDAEAGSPRGEGPGQAPAPHPPRGPLAPGVGVLMPLRLPTGARAWPGLEPRAPRGDRMAVVADCVSGVDAAAGEKSRRASTQSCTNHTGRAKGTKRT
jgi:hypothetical protein